MSFFDALKSLGGAKDKKFESLEEYEYTLSDNTWGYTETVVSTAQIKNAQDNLNKLFEKYGDMIAGRKLIIEKCSPKIERFADEYFFNVEIDGFLVGRIYHTAECYRDLIKKNVNRVYAEIAKETVVNNSRVQEVNVIKMFFKLGKYDGRVFKLGIAGAGDTTAAIEEDVEKIVS